MTTTSMTSMTTIPRKPHIVLPEEFAAMRASGDHRAMMLRRTELVLAVDGRIRLAWEALRWEASILRETHHLGFLDVVVDAIRRYYRTTHSPEYLPTCLEFEHWNRIFREECLEWQRLERHGQLIGQWRWESAAASLGRMQTVAIAWRLLGEQLFILSQRQQAQHQRLSYSRETGEFTPLGVRFGNNSLEKVGSDRLGCGDDLTLADCCISSEEMDSIMERLADYFEQPTTDIWDHYHACRDLCDVQSG